MKGTLKLIIGLLFISQTCLGQFVHVHTHFNNNDKKTRQKLVELGVTVGARNGIMEYQNSLLSQSNRNMEKMLDENYKRKHNYEEKDGASLAASIVSSLASTTVSKYAVLPYMTRTKREYFENLSKDRAILLALMYLDKSKIKSSKRQEIYQLRSELIKEFSKYDKDARRILFFSALGLVVINYATFSELSGTLKVANIVL
ncbi:hypothetical protein [Aquimarina spongiae]|uniref:Uncharacterized protein n=1 Tax=Aquimarina spongiae TaxID=570521 RepID=A0A1M6I5Z2_9FLAO|nr:hypothetical protein [Aquimarina spongiae]SHJ29879.1 hypothetical protein SAMN04488508_107139 [Aquimarina spongiae]